MSDNTTSSSSPQQSIYHSVINSKIHAKNLVTSPKKLSKLVHSQQRSRYSQPPGGDRAFENNSYLSGGENAIESGHEISAPNLERISSRLSTNLSALKPEYDEHSEQEEEEGDIVETDIEQQLGVENDEEDEDKSEDESENENRNRKKNGNEDSDEENSETQSQQSNLVFSTLLSEDSEDYSSLFNHGAEGNGYYARNGSNNNVFINVLFKYIFIANCIIYFYIGVSSMFNDQDKEKDRESRRNLTLLLLGSIIYSCVFSMMIFWTLSLTHAISRRLVAGWIWIITISVPVACLYTFFISAYTLFVTKPDWQSKYSNIVLLVSTLGLLIRSFKYVLYIKTVTGTINKAIDLFLFVFNTFLSYDFSSSPPVQPGQNLNVETGMSREDNIEGNSYNDRLLHQESQPQPQPKHKHKPQRGQQNLEEEEHNSPMSVPETTKKRRATNHYLSFALFNFALSVGFSLFLVPNSIISVLGLAYVICFLIQLERFITSVSVSNWFFNRHELSFREDLLNHPYFVFILSFWFAITNSNIFGSISISSLVLLLNFVCTALSFVFKFFFYSLYIVLLPVFSVLFGFIKIIDMLSFGLLRAIATSCRSGFEVLFSSSAGKFLSRPFRSVYKHVRILCKYPLIYCGILGLGNNVNSSITFFKAYNSVYQLLLENNLFLPKSFNALHSVFTNLAILISILSTYFLGAFFDATYFLPSVVFCLVFPFISCYFFVKIFDDILDTLLVCYAIDLSTNSCHSVEIDQLFAFL